MRPALLCSILLAACGSGAKGGGGGDAGGTADATPGGGTIDAATTAGCGAGCPDGSTCGHANGLEVCRAASGVPRFTSIFVIVMENVTQSTLADAITQGQAPNLATATATYATAADYHGVDHPSLTNYIALTSGDTQGIGCDCHPDPTAGTCNGVTCNLVLHSCGCVQSVSNLGDQLETAGKTWMAYGEDMGTPCNLTDAGNYAVRHLPFLYFDDVQSDAARCAAHVVDLGGLDLAAPASFVYVAPNLVDDMHDPFPSDATNIPNGDGWIGPQIAAIVDSPAYQAGGLLVVVWDEDDNSGGLFGSDDPIPLYVMSPYAKHGGYVSAAAADHYSLLATIEDGLGLPRLGQAGTSRAGRADTLADFFPAE